VEGGGRGQGKKVFSCHLKEGKKHLEREVSVLGGGLERYPVGGGKKSSLRKGEIV